MAYTSIWEQLTDELNLLDLLIHQQVLQLRNTQPLHPLDQFKGLVLSDEEINGLLASPNTALPDVHLAEPDDSQSLSLAESVKHLLAQIEERRAATLQEGTFLPLSHLSRLFQLTLFEERCLIICLAPELSRKYEKLYAYLQDDVTWKNPCVDLTLNLLCPSMLERAAARLSFDPQAPLLKYRLLEMSESSAEHPSTLLSRTLKLDERIANFLLSLGQMDYRLEPFTQFVTPRVDAAPPAVSGDVRERMLQLLNLHYSQNNASQQNLVFYFYGPSGAGKKSLAKSVCGELGLPLLLVNVGKMLAASRPFEETIYLLGREAVLQFGALCFEGMENLLVDDDQHRRQLPSLAEMLGSLSRLTFLLGAEEWRPQELFKEHLFVALNFPRPDERERLQLWESELASRDRLPSDVNAGTLASKFRFTAGQIQDALVTAQRLAHWRAPGEASVTMEDLETACRAHSNAKLGTLARKVEAKRTWEDLILPSDQLSQIREICHQAQHRHIVYGTWGFDRKLSLGKGLNVLFSGPSGTGKTLTAEVISNALRLDLYKIDLSQVVSKYIGETEKNLHRIFLEAQMSNAILFFDEADALFGKRSEVKDAHDRYANIEIGYLLQKMEEYEGIVILATNLRQHIDEAFVRRMNVIVEFPFPDEEYRRRIWEVTFPAEAPLGADVNFEKLAREIQLAGGNIKNIALAAAFYAAQDGKVITTEHLVRAAGREYQKLGRTWSHTELSAQA